MRIHCIAVSTCVSSQMKRRMKSAARSAHAGIVKLGKVALTGPASKPNMHACMATTQMKKNWTRTY